MNTFTWLLSSAKEETQDSKMKIPTLSMTCLKNHPLDYMVLELKCVLKLVLQFNLLKPIFRHVWFCHLIVPSPLLCVIQRLFATDSFFVSMVPKDVLEFIHTCSDPKTNTVFFNVTYSWKKAYGAKWCCNTLPTLFYHMFLFFIFKQRWIIDYHIQVGALYAVLSAHH